MQTLCNPTFSSDDPVPTAEFRYVNYTKLCYPMGKPGCSAAVRAGLGLV
jgi:hypothetical protein